MPAEPIKSAVRTLALFEQFAAKQQPMSINEIAAVMEMPQSSTSVLVKSLVTLGYLSHDIAQRTYYPTMRVALLGTWMRRRHTEIEKLPRLLSDVADATGESAIISMRNGIFAQHIFAQHGSNRLRLAVDSSMLFPLACSAPGWSLLSIETDQEIGKIIRRTQAEVPVERWRDTAAGAMDKVLEMREQGYVVSAGQTAEGIAAVSVLLRARDKAFAVSVGGPLPRIHEHQDDIVDTMKRLIGSVTSDEVDDIVSAARSEAEITSSLADLKLNQQ